MTRFYFCSLFIGWQNPCCSCYMKQFFISKASLKIFFKGQMASEVGFHVHVYCAKKVLLHKFTCIFLAYNLINDKILWCIFKKIEFPVQWVVNCVATILARDTAASWMTYPPKVKVTKLSQLWKNNPCHTSLHAFIYHITILINKLQYSKTSLSHPR